MSNKISLNKFITEEQDRLHCFEVWWEEMHKLNPEQFPLSFSEDNSGLWEEALQDYCIFDEVFKIEEK